MAARERRVGRRAHRSARHQGRGPDTAPRGIAHAHKPPGSGRGSLRGADNGRGGEEVLPGAEVELQGRERGAARKLWMGDVFYEAKISLC